MQLSIFTGISFNGIDEKTDLKRLELIQKEYPFAEFGVILSKNWQENGNRYYNPEKLKDLKGRSLSLSAHLCGSIAREAIKDNWQPAIDLCDGYFDIFARSQINIAPYNNNPEVLEFSNIPDNLNEIIIQQRPANYKLFDEYYHRTRDKKVVMLLDGSGGLGIEGTFTGLHGLGKLGYAGGLNEKNIIKNTLAISLSTGMENFWMDLESGCRTDDWFDLSKIEYICSQVAEVFCFV